MTYRSALHLLFLLIAIQPGLGQSGTANALEEFIVSRSADRPKRGAFRFADLCPTGSSVLADQVFREYGSIFAATDKVDLPPTCIFNSETEVAKFQESIDTRSAVIGGFHIELQENAMDALLEAVEEAKERGVRITPLDGAIAGKRSFADTERLWRSRFLPALEHWIARGKITREEADRVRTMSVVPQVERVLAWEALGYYFSTGKNRPIMRSVAPPGTSQHLSLLAFDVEQSSNRTVREILNRHGWYRTVVNDTPHFTFLGLDESRLPERGLIKVVSGGVEYWVPRTKRPAPRVLPSTPPHP